MGQSFNAVCHTCDVFMPLHGAKIAEIEMNDDYLIEVAKFTVRHAGHLIELRGDQWTQSCAVTDREFEKYSKEEIEVER